MAYGVIDQKNAPPILTKDIVISTSAPIMLSEVFFVKLSQIDFISADCHFRSY